MYITTKTKIKDILPRLMLSDRMERILKDIPEYPLETSLFSLTIGEFSNIILDEEKFLESILSSDKLAYKVLGRLKTYRKEMEQIADFLKKHEIKQDADTKLASQGIDFPNHIASMLIETSQFFHLPSLEAAEKVKLSEYMILLQYKCANYRFERNYRKIQENKQKQHAKR